MLLSLKCFMFSKVFCSDLLFIFSYFPSYHIFSFVYSVLFYIFLTPLPFTYAFRVTLCKLYGIVWFSPVATYFFTSINYKTSRIYFVSIFKLIQRFKKLDNKQLNFRWTTSFWKMDLQEKSDILWIHIFKTFLKRIRGFTWIAL